MWASCALSWSNTLLQCNTAAIHPLLIKYSAELCACLHSCACCPIMPPGSRLFGVYFCPMKTYPHNYWGARRYLHWNCKHVYVYLWFIAFPPCLWVDTHKDVKRCLFAGNVLALRRREVAAECSSERLWNGNLSTPRWALGGGETREQWCHLLWQVSPCSLWRGNLTSQPQNS